MSDDTLVSALARAARRPSGLDFLDARGRVVHLGFAELQARARRAAAALREAGVKRGDRVALVVGTSPAFVDAFFGCEIAGAIPVPMSPPLRLGRLDEYWDATSSAIARVRAVALIAESRVRRLLGTVVARTSLPLGVHEAESLARPGRRVAPFHDEPAPDDIAFIQLSSGSTREPSPVPLRHREILANVDTFVAEFGDPEANRGLSWLPLHHDMGLIGGLGGAVRAGRPLALLPPEVFLARPATWLRSISSQRATVSPAPDFAYALAAERVRDDELDGVDLSSWRFALDGAEPICADALRAFARRFERWGFRPESLTPVYGLAEAALAVSFSDASKAFVTRRFDGDALGREEAHDGEERGIELVGVGRPLPGYEVELRDARGAPVREGRVGRIWVRGPSVSQAVLAARGVTDGWLDTGDRGVRVDGELFVTGRDKDVVVVRGRKHPPEPLERACNAVAGVRKGCAVAFGDLGEDGRERVVVLVESREPPRDLAPACREAIAAATGIAVDRVDVLAPGTLPRTTSGKLRRREAREQWRRGSLAPPRKVSRARVALAAARATFDEVRASMRGKGARP